MRLPVLVAIGHIGPAVIAEVLLRSVNAVVITMAESFTVGLAQLPFNVGIAILFAVVHVRIAVIAVVPLRAFDAIAEAAPLCLVELARRIFPAPILPVSPGQEWGGGRGSASN